MKQWLRDLDVTTQILLALLSMAFLALLFAAILGKVHTALYPTQPLPRWVAWLTHFIP